MPKGRGRRGEKAPRKKGKNKKQTPLTIVPRIISSQNSPRMDVEGLLPSSHHDQQSSFQRQIVSTTSRSVNAFQPLNVILNQCDGNLLTTSLPQPVSSQRPPSLVLQATSRTTSFQTPMVLNNVQRHQRTILYLRNKRQHCSSKQHLKLHLFKLQ